MTHRIESKKWILYRHINDFNLLCTVAEYLKSYSKTTISKSEKAKLNLKLRDLNLYNERNPDMPLDAINHKINQLSYYMFGYQSKVDGVDRFLFSPLGNLLLKHLGDKAKSAKVFLAMLFAVQYPHPHSGTDDTFNLFPFRLIFKLLLDPRLQNKLHAYEVAYYVVFQQTMSEATYDQLVNKILDIRTWSDERIIKSFKKDEHAYVNATYEWDYYVTNLFSSAGIVNRTEGEVITQLLHGTTTKRKLTKNKIELIPALKILCSKLLAEYPFDEQPLSLNDPKRLKIDVVKGVYGFYPKVLLEEIGELVDEFKSELLNLSKLIERYSNNNEGEEAYLFEKVLEEGFNLFYNVDAKVIGGAGNTDLECLYLAKKKKFAIDAKSTKNKLSGINSGRLAGHRTKIGGEYTIVVTPQYVRAVLQDIKSTPIVIIRASTFSEYLYNCINNNVRKIDYEDFDSIITKNLGTDISKKISNLTIERFAAKS